MKRLILFIVAIISVLNAFAQETDSLRSQSAVIPIDSLSLRFNKLQHDYDFMYCDYELHKLIMDLKDLSHSIEISSNRVFINFYHSRFDNSLYNAYIKDYDSDCALYDSLKEKIDVVKIAVLAKMMSSGFSEQELNVLYASFGVIQKATTMVDSNLNYYDLSIKAYNSIR